MSNTSGMGLKDILMLRTEMATVASLWRQLKLTQRIEQHKRDGIEGYFDAKNWDAHSRIIVASVNQ